MEIHMNNDNKHFHLWMYYLFKITVVNDPSQGAWLTGDLTNHNAKSAILSDKQIRQESRLT